MGAAAAKCILGELRGAATWGPLLCVCPGRKSWGVASRTRAHLT
eukprot:CAMPEP_0176121120 /NCGR_PEP_ID=MMETSP0120_2-20121206/60951_1 /TAXON_ID=160619 /ORGANISM="Kryptoperidinium foliaceum, Strain CCMP 1326" /LENGTH=43 /DNA_ID= /DNA_START= /DNA_END= /DNA_ORIENTATION=